MGAVILGETGTTEGGAGDEGVFVYFLRILTSALLVCSDNALKPSSTSAK